MKVICLYKPKSILFSESLANCPQKPPFCAQKAFLFAQTFLITLQNHPFPPSISHSHPAITYCPQKRTAVLFISALNPHAVTQEPRTDSKPFRRHFVRKTGFDTCRRELFQDYFRQSFESSPGVQRVATLDLLETWSPCSRPFAILPVSAVSDAQKLATGNFLCVRAYFCGTFCTPQKVPKNVPLQGASRFSKPRYSARRNGGFPLTKLKPSQRELRGFANLESAHPNNDFTRT